MIYVTLGHFSLALKIKKKLLTQSSDQRASLGNRITIPLFVLEKVKHQCPLGKKRQNNHKQNYERKIQR